MVLQTDNSTLNHCKHCNTYIHGTIKKENREMQIQQCHDCIDELYNQDWRMFTIEQQTIVKVQKNMDKMRVGSNKPFDLNS